MAQEEARKEVKSRTIKKRWSIHRRKWGRKRFVHLAGCTHLACRDYRRFCTPEEWEGWRRGQHVHDFDLIDRGMPFEMSVSEESLRMMDEADAEAGRRYDRSVERDAEAQQFDTD